MEPLVIITGLSGSGKSLAAQSLEDLDFFCVDNLPVGLIPAFCELVKRGSEQMQRAALVIDARERTFVTDAPSVMKGLRESGFPIELLFFECTPEVLKRRYSESRRPHPLTQLHASLDDALTAERTSLEPVREMADRIIDTSHYTSHQLKAFMKSEYGPDDARTTIRVNPMSFGFKYGVPPEADLVFDVRFLPNPYFVEGLRPLNGKSDEIQNFLKKQPSFHEFETHLRTMLDFLLPHYTQEGKAYLNVCIGCTGGKHRSVALTERLGEYLAKHGFNVTVAHRDLGKE